MLGIYYWVPSVLGLPKEIIKGIQEITKNDLEKMKDVRVPAIRLVGDSPDFLFETAHQAKKMGFKVWIGPGFNRKIPMPDKKGYLKTIKDFAIQAKKVNADVFVIGNELSIELSDFAGNQIYQDHIEDWKTFQRQLRGKEKEFRNYLILLAKEVKERFPGPITYAAAGPLIYDGERWGGRWELDNIEWDIFDVVAANFYWSKCIPKNRYIFTLRKLKMLGKPVAVTEFGFQTIREAFDFGGSSSRKQKYPWHYSEDTQAKLLKRNIELLQQSGIEYAFLHQWREFDNSGFGIIKGDGKSKKAFKVISRYFSKFS